MTASMLVNAPLGISWNTIPGLNTSAQAQLAEQTNIAWRATRTVDNFCNQTLRATIDTDMPTGPDFRLTVDNNGIGHYIFLRNPVIDVLSVAATSSATFPPQWTSIPTTNVLLEQAPAVPFGTTVPGMAPIGGATLSIQPGWVTWFNGRNGVRLQITYVDGWPHCGLTAAFTTTGTFTAGSFDVTVADPTSIQVGLPVTGAGIPTGATVVSISGTTMTLSAAATANGAAVLLQFGYLAGTTQFNVDDVTGWVNSSTSGGAMGQLFDGAYTESVTAATTTATTAGLTWPMGPGTITLSSATLYPHAAGTLLSTLPDDIMWATMLFAAAEALTRGGTATTVQTISGSEVNGEGGAEALETMARKILMPYARII